MRRINNPISLKSALVMLALLLVISALVFVVNFLFKENANNDVSLDQEPLKVTSQKLYFEINPEISVFLSKQEISLLNSQASRRDLIFLIYPSLIIDRLDFNNDQGTPLVVEEWHYITPVQYPRLSGTVVLNQVLVHFAQDIESRQVLTLYLDYHLARESFQTGLGTNLYELFVSSQDQHAVGFDSGAFPVIESNEASPLEIKIRHPNTERCGIPGKPIAEETDGKFNIVTYQVSQASDPAFACAVYQKQQKSLDGATVEFYLPPGQVYIEKMSDIALQYFQLYRQLFGNPENNTFRFVFMPVNVQREAGGSENKGNTVYLGRTNRYDLFEQDGVQQLAFKIMAGREEFRYWNRFQDGWSGSLIEWWSEGGANFMSAWAGEILWGKETGRLMRAQYLADLDQSMGYLFPGTLESPDRSSDKNSGSGEKTLTQDYGALVWEQLRQLMGDTALQAGLREFFEQSSQREGTVAGLIQILQRHTRADVTAFLKQWTSRNARIDLTIKQVTTQPAGSQFATTVTVNVAADDQYVFFTSLGYTSDDSQAIDLVPIQITHLGDSIVEFTSQRKPVTLQIDPEVRVPQTNIRNDDWPIR